VGNFGPDRVPASLLEGLDRGLRVFVTDHPFVAVALLTDDSAACVCLREPEAFARCLELALARALARSSHPELLFVETVWDGGQTAEIRIAAPHPNSVLEEFRWACCGTGASK